MLDQLTRWQRALYWFCQIGFWTQLLNLREGDLHRSLVFTALFLLGIVLLAVKNHRLQTAPPVVQPEDPAPTPAPRPMVSTPLEEADPGSPLVEVESINQGLLNRIPGVYPFEGPVEVPVDANRLEDCCLNCGENPTCRVVRGRLDELWWNICPFYQRREPGQDLPRTDVGI